MKQCPMVSLLFQIVLAGSSAAQWGGMKCVEIAGVIFVTVKLLRKNGGFGFLSHRLNDTQHLGYMYMYM